MFEDPWKDLLPSGQQNEEAAAAPPTLSDSSTTNQDDAATDMNQKPDMVTSTVDNSAGKTDTEATNTGDHSEISPNVESCVSADGIGTSGGCIGTTGNETDAQPQNSVLVGTSASSTDCVREDCQSTAAMGDAGDTSNKATSEGSGDHRCVTSTDQESLQIKESTCTEVQDGE
jgi:hypothetical protein